MSCFIIFVCTHNDSEDQTCASPPPYHHPFISSSYLYRRHNLLWQWQLPHLTADPDPHGLAILTVVINVQEGAPPPNALDHSLESPRPTSDRVVILPSWDPHLTTVDPYLISLWWIHVISLSSLYGEYTPKSNNNRAVTPSWDLHPTYIDELVIFHLTSQCSDVSISKKGNNLKGTAPTS